MGLKKKHRHTHRFKKKEFVVSRESPLLFLFFNKKNIYFLCFSQIFTWQLLLLLLFVSSFFLLGKQKIHFACLFFLLSLLIFCFIIILEIFSICIEELLVTTLGVRVYRAIHFPIYTQILKVKGWQQTLGTLQFSVFYPPLCVWRRQLRRRLRLNSINRHRLCWQQRRR